MAFYNRTRTSASIPRRMLDEGAWYLLPLFALLRTSDLGREGLEGSGSWRFADHLYRGVPSGRFGIGWLVDAISVSLPSAHAFRERYRFVRDELIRAIPGLIARNDESVRVASIPSGIPRDLVEACAALEARGDLDRHEAALEMIAIDLDPEPLDAAKSLASDAGVASRFTFVCADAFDESAAGGESLDIITSTGFGEFLLDEQLVAFLASCRRRLAPGGLLLTTATGRDPFSSFVLERVMELRATYRSREQIAALVREAGFGEVRTRTVGGGRQTFVMARSRQAA